MSDIPANDILHHAFTPLLFQKDEEEKEEVNDRI
jgi:hypothetical protein